MLSNKIEKRASTISGIGLFAKEPIQKNQVIWRPTNDTVRKIPVDELSKLPKNEKKHWIDHSYQIGTHLFVDTDETIFMNHSCNPNAIDSDDGVFIIAARNISKDEEVVWNYLPFMNPFQTFQCKCNSQNCVGLVKKGKIAAPVSKFK